MEHVLIHATIEVARSVNMLLALKKSVKVLQDYAGTEIY